MKRTYNKEEYQKQQKLQTDELKKNYLEVIQGFKDDPKKLKEFAQFTEQFYKYSPKNTILIFSQNPKARFVGSYKYYKDNMDCNVLKGEKGLNVFAPVKITYFKNEYGEKKKISEATEQEKIKLKCKEYETYVTQSFKLGKVFDISQTSFEKERYPEIFGFGKESKTHDELYKHFKEVCKNKFDVKVEENRTQGATVRGYYVPRTNSIVISDKLNDTQKLATLTHEMGHAMLHTESTIDTTQLEQIEVEADIYTLMVTSMYDIPVEEATLSHLKKNFDKINIEQFEKALTNAQAGVCKFVKEIENKQDQSQDHENEEEQELE